MVDLMNVFAESALFQPLNCEDYYLKEIRMESEVSLGAYPSSKSIKTVFCVLEVYPAKYEPL